MKHLTSGIFLVVLTVIIFQQSLQQMGNSRARAVYEANLPDDFRRPQLDSALEQFIRAKYEAKKYIAREWVPPPLPKVTGLLDLIFKFLNLQAVLQSLCNWCKRTNIFLKKGSSFSTP